MMDPTAPSDDLPAMYRAVLDRVAELERCGKRDLAQQVRSEAIRIYSRAWDDRARRGLEAMLRRNLDAPAGRQLPGRGLRRRSVRAT